MGYAALFEAAPGPDAGLTYQAPSCPEEFWRRDWVYVVKLVRTLLGNGQEAEDVAADIFEKLLKRDVPGMYKPGTVSTHTKRPVTWRAFLSTQVALYVRGKGEQVSKRLWREPLWCDAPASAGSQTGRWVELFGGEVWDDYPSLSDSEFISRVRDHLAAMPEWQGISLLTVFEKILTRVNDGEKVSVSYLRKQFGITGSDAHAVLGRLRQVIAGSIPPPPSYEVAGMKLTATEVRAAADALESSKGNRVRPAFVKAGHKLAAAGTKWYLAFAAEEVEQFPELKVPKGSHVTGHTDQVKRAVIHRLKRMVSLAAVPDPQPAQDLEPEEDTPADVLEARLWQLGATGKDVEEIMTLAREAFA